MKTDAKIIDWTTDDNLCKNVAICWTTAEHQWKKQTIRSENCLKPNANGWNRLENGFKPLVKLWHILGHLTPDHQISVYFSWQVGHPGRPFPGKVNYRKNRTVRKVVTKSSQKGSRSDPAPKVHFSNWEFLWKLFPETGSKQIMKAIAKINEINWRSDENHGKVVKSVEKEVKPVEV